MARDWYENIEVEPNRRKLPPPQPLEEQLAAGIQMFRKRQKMSQTELARLAGTSQAAIVRLEKGQGNPTIKVILRVLDALGYNLQLSWRQK